MGPQGTNALFALTDIGFTTETLNSTTTALALTFVAPKSGTVSKVHFNVTAATGSPTAKLRLETTGIDGFPSGTLAGGSAEHDLGTLTTGAKSITLGTPATVTAGTVYQAVIVLDGGTSAAISVGSDNPPDWFPSTCRRVTDTWFRLGRTGGIGVEYSDGEVIQGTYGLAGSPSGTSLQLGSGTRVGGLKFTAHADCSLTRVSWRGNTASGDTFVVRVYEGASPALGSPVAEVTIDSDAFDISGTARRINVAIPPVALTRGTVYRVVIGGTAAGMALRHLTFASSECRRALSDGVYTTHDNSAWTDSDTMLPYMELGFGDYTAGGGVVVVADDSAHATLTRGGEDQSILVMIRNATTGAPLTGLAHDTSGLTAYYKRGGDGAATEIPLADQTAEGAHTDGGFCAADEENMPALYRLDLPDAVAAAGADGGAVMLKGAADMLACPVMFSLADEVPLSSQGLPLVDAAQTPIPELTGDPGAEPTLAGAVALAHMALRNQGTATASARAIHNDAGSPVLTATLSDDSTTFTKGKFQAPE